MDPLSPLGLKFAAFRFGVVIFGLIVAAILWRRPRPLGLLVATLAMHLAAWWVYTAPLGRLYGLEEHLDRAFNVGMAASVAVGNSAWEHTQVGFANLEPFWSFVLAALAGFRPENVIAALYWLSPATLLTVGVAFYFGLPRQDDPGDAWERALIVFSVFGLASYSVSQSPPVPALWAANFLLKPNHACAWIFLAIGLGVFVRNRSPWVLGLLLGLMAWVFVLDWAFFIVGLAATLLLWRAPWSEWRKLAIAVGISVLIAAPYLRHLTRDHNPFGSGETPAQIWRDSLGQWLALPHWATWDLGPLFLLALFGAVAAWKRRGPRDRAMLGLLAGAWAVWLGYEVGALFSFTPEPDEFHFYLRLVMGLVAGTGLAALGRHVASVMNLDTARGSIAVFAAAMPLTLPAYWDPPLMDRYYVWSVPPIRAKVLEYGKWVRENTPPDAVFAAGRSSCIWIPVLSGRRVLLAERSRPPADYEARHAAQKLMLISRDPRVMIDTARKFGVTHIAIDQEILERWGPNMADAATRRAAYEPLFMNGLVRIYRVRPEPLPIERAPQHDDELEERREGGEVSNLGDVQQKSVQ